VYTQQHRPIRLDTPLGVDVLLLTGFEGRQDVSAPFHYRLHMLSVKDDLALADLLRQPVVVSIELADGGRRYIHARVKSASQFDRQGELTEYQAEIVPWLWFLSLSSDCRIFQNKTVSDIVETVFKEQGFTDFRWQLYGTYEPRTYCTEYRETHLNFVSRLLEEEGIYYFFEHTEDKHVLVLTDSKASIKPCAHQDSAPYRPAVGDIRDQDVIFTVERAEQASTGNVALTDYDFEKASTSLAANVTSADPGEYYDYPGNYKTRAEGDRYAKVRLEEREVSKHVIRARTNCRAVETGYRFAIHEHYRGDVNQPYLLLSVEEKVGGVEYRSGVHGDFVYENSFLAMPSSVPFRPPRVARKPAVRGSQTAVVSGKSGEEIWVDKYGRIKVQFHWDRLGKQDENTTCWIRVAQTWAGKGWGAVILPRIGQEVVVDFLEGDPDHPLVTGVVYNSEHMPPYALPDHQTMSTLKSMSSKGGGGFNEIRFEDKKGEEQIFLYAQKNMDTRVTADAFETVGNDLHLDVKKDQLEHIENDVHRLVDRDQVEEIGRDQHFEVRGKQTAKIDGDRSLTVGGSLQEKIGTKLASDAGQEIHLKAGMKVVIEAGVQLSLKVGGNFIDINPAGVAIQGTMVMINSGGAAGAGSGSSPASPITPKKAFEADTANPGEMATIKAEQRQQRTGKYGAPLTIPHRPASTPPGEEPKKNNWVEVKLVDMENKPVVGEAYQVWLGEQVVAEGTLDKNGYAKVEGFDPSEVKVTFPNLDKSVWEAS
jgi:type VI secretion system secreted protein VgrG